MVENCCSKQFWYLWKFQQTYNPSGVFQPISCLHKWIFSQSTACTSGFSANQLHAQVDFQPISCLHKQISCSQLLVQVHIVQLFGQLYFSQSAACTMHMQISANQLHACTMHMYISANQLLAHVYFSQSAACTSRFSANKI